MGSGFSNSLTGLFLRAFSIYWFQIGAATLEPSAPSLILLFLVFPTQTPATKFGVKPRVQASLNSLVVPVLAATGLFFRVKLLFSPKTKLLAWLSESISLIVLVVWALNTLFGFRFLSWLLIKTFPFLSLTFKILL